MSQEEKTAGVVLVADDLAAWLVGLLADAGRKKLTTLVLGSEQERALRPAAVAAVEATAAQLVPAGEQAEQLVMAVGEVFRDPPKVALAGQVTLLEALQAGIAETLAVLDDPDVTGTGQSSMELLGVLGGVLAEALAGHLVHEITVRGARGGPLTPLADQLNQDITHLQGQRLEGMLAQVVSLVTALAREGGGPQVPRKPVRLPPRPALLVGREELLTDLDTKLTGGGDSGPRIVALYGLGGAGKTSLAVEYVHRHLAKVGVAWQFAAEDATVLAAGFGELAAQLGAHDLPGSRDPVASVHAVLAAYPTDWLLVFDNALDRASVEALLPPAGPGGVLVISQSAVWPPGWAVEVPVLDAQVAAEFLVTRTGDADQEAARELATQLGGLPLALEQAAAYSQATGASLATYVSLFRDRRADLLARGEVAGHPASVAATLGLALSRLVDEAPAAVGLVRVLACLAPEPVPLALLLADAQAAGKLAPEVVDAVGPLLGDRVAVGDAVAALRRYSLVTPAGDGAVLMHRLVQAIALDQIPAEVASHWEQAAVALVEAAVPADTKLPAAWPTCAVLLPHARAVLGLTSDGMWNIAQYLGFTGSYLVARDLFLLIADAFREDDAYGAEHPRTLAARGELAHWTGMAGDAAGACDEFTALLPLFERVLGAEHPSTLTVHGSLASSIGEAGDAAGARDQYAALLPIYERVLGAEHPDTLTIRVDLVGWTSVAGDAAGARDQLTALLPIYEQARGAEHPDTLATRSSLAFVTGQAGDAAGARDQYADLLPIDERVLGAEHPSTLTVRGHLAQWAGMAGDAAGARDQYAALLPIEEQVLGAEHPDTLATRGHLAQWAGMAGDAAGARDQYAALLPIEERVLGAEHSDTLTTRANVAHWTGMAGDAAGACSQYAALLPIEERVLGAEHPDTLTIRANLVGWTGQAFSQPGPGVD